MMSKDIVSFKKRRLQLPLFSAPEIETPRPEGAPRQRRMTAVLRLAGFSILLALVFLLVDLRPVLSHVWSMSAAALVTMTALHILIILLASWRFAVIARSFGASIPLRDASNLTFTSTLANMLLPTSLAGDAGRVVLVRRFGMTLGSAAKAGIYDRVIGLASLGFVVLIGALAVPSIVPVWVLGVIGAFVVALGAVILWCRRPQDGTAPDKDNLVRPNAVKTLSVAVAASLAAHILSIAIAAVFLMDRGIGVDVVQLLVLFPAVLLAGSVPVSVGGWGTREIAAAAAFAAVGLAPATAIAMAFMYGVTQVAAAVMGCAGFLLFWSGRKSK